MGKTRKGEIASGKQWEKWYLKELKFAENIKAKNSYEDAMNRENVGPKEEKEDK